MMMTRTPPIWFFFQSFRFQSAAHTALIKIIMIICSDYLSRSESNSKAILAEECFALKQFRSWWLMVIILDKKLTLTARFTMFRWLKQKPVFQEEWVEVSKVSPPTSKLVNKANQDWLREQKYNTWIQWQRKKDVNNYLVIGFSLAKGRKLWAGFFCIVLLKMSLLRKSTVGRSVW